MIDADKSPECAQFERKLAKFYREHKGLEQLIHELALFEANMRESAAKIGIYESMARRLREICPLTINQDLLSQVEARQMLVKMRNEVRIADEVISRFQ